MLEFIKENIPWIALGFAIIAAVVIVALLVVNVLKKRKETESQVENEVATSEISKSEPISQDIAEEEKEEVHIIYKTLDDDDKNNVKENKAERGKAKFAKQTAERLSEVSNTDTKNVVGKWVVKEKGDDEYVAYLYANNGELILTSEIYSTADGAKKGIDTIRKNLSGGSMNIYRDKNDNYYFKLKSVKNRILCVGETYKSKIICENAFESVKRFAPSPVQEEVENDLTVIKYEPADTVENSDGKYSGKWKIEEKDGTFMAKLFASNGELLLNSESYVSYDSAKSAVEVIRNNGLSKNFIIDSDKKGRYFFKLRSAQKATLCVGETYPQLSACKNAVDSVYRFLKTATIDE